MDAIVIFLIIYSIPALIILFSGIKLILLTYKAMMVLGGVQKEDWIALIKYSVLTILAAVFWLPILIYERIRHG